LIDFLGPIKAQTFRVASRLANNLRAGYSVKTFEELDDSRVILIAVPDSLLAETVEDLVRSRINWHGKVAVLCGSSRDCSELRRLVSSGAATASLEEIEGMQGQFVAEGHRMGVREIRALVQPRGTKIFELRESQKALYHAGVSFATNLIVPLVESSFECLMRAGLSSTTASAVITVLTERSVRGYLKAGRKARSGRLAVDSSVEATREADALARIDPLLSEYFRQNMSYAIQALNPRTRREFRKS
jgi:predicted short-subunit dehydrogenase-like oxidoreductase (DUF2520 family)